jgi:hypothetical protein
MRADIKRIKLLFKAKIQPAKSSSSQGGDERHNTVVYGCMHSGEAKITDLIGEHLQTIEKTKMGGGRQERGVETKRERRRKQICSILLSGLFFEG